MSQTQSFWRSKAALIIESGFIFLPLLSLLLMVLAWLKHGIDLPYWDDWSDYTHGKAGSFSLNHLFKPETDTLYPGGRLLDSLAQQLLDGNTIAYQSISMVMVLGGLLWVQWKLLNYALASRFLAACAFVAALFMLQPDSYWGYQNIAYHQALPLLYLILAVYISVANVFSRPVTLLALVTLSLLSGLTYISGAFSSLALSISFILCGLVFKPFSRLKSYGAALLLPSLITVAAQSWVILFFQEGHIHVPGMPWSMPYTAKFWFYALGKTARSLALPSDDPTLSLTFIVIALVFTLACFSYISWLYFKRKTASQVDENALIVFISLAAILGVYLAIIAAGRANVAAYAIQEWLKIFQIGFNRFHFFWLSILWPWMIAFFFIAMSKFCNSKKLKVVAAITAMLTAATAFNLGTMDHEKAMIRAADLRTKDLQCLQQTLLTSQKISCPSAYPFDLTQAYEYAVKIDASFIKYIPPILRRLNPSKSANVFEMTEESTIRVNHARIVGRNFDTLKLSEGQDVQLIFETGNPYRMQECKLLAIDVEVHTPASDNVQLFYLPKGTSNFSESNSIKLSTASTQDLQFVVSSPQGFQDTLRIDPVSKTQISEIQDLEVRCLFPQT